jgi:integrase/recombinase XerD
MVNRMKPTDFATRMTAFLSQYLPGQRNVSVNTIKSYRDTFKLLLLFCHGQKGIAPEYLTIAHMNDKLIAEFLGWLEKERSCGISTRNQRLAAIHSFFRYLQMELPEHLLSYQRILSIPFKKTGKAMVNYLTFEALKCILEQPDRSSRGGRRDLLLLTLLYDTGARVQELIDLLVRNIRIEKPSLISLTGKGNKTRQVPLLGKTTKLLSDYLAEHHLMSPAMIDYPVFCNKQGNKLTRAGVTYILNKYVKTVRVAGFYSLPDKVTPHVLRHTKAMHLLQANVNLVYIRDLLGHVSVTTTEMYARADTEVKRLVLEKAYVDIVTDDIPKWSEDKDLLSWLHNLCG